MSTPLEFLYHFRALLRASGIRFAIASGMAPHTRPDTLLSGRSEDTVFAVTLAPPARAHMDIDKIQFSEAYYEQLAENMGQEAADWARLPRAERERVLTLYHQTFNTPDDLSLWPAELDGGVDRP